MTPESRIEILEESRAFVERSEETHEDRGFAIVLKSSLANSTVCSRVYDMHLSVGEMLEGSLACCFTLAAPRYQNRADADQLSWPVQNYA